MSTAQYSLIAVALGVTLFALGHAVLGKRPGWYLLTAMSVLGGLTLLETIAAFAVRALNGTEGATGKFWIYGFVAISIVPFGTSYAKPFETRSDCLILAATCATTAAVVWRQNVLGG